MSLDLTRLVYSYGQFHQAEDVYDRELYPDAVRSFFLCLKMSCPTDVILHFSKNFQTFQISDLTLMIQGSINDKYVIAEAEIDFPFQFPEAAMTWEFIQYGRNGLSTVLYFEIPISEASPVRLFNALKEIVAAAASTRSS